jgi:hypothetical protein
MNPMAMTSRFVTVATLGLLGAFAAMASPIPVINFSFETPQFGGVPVGCGSNCSFTVGAIPGWLGSNTHSGQFKPGTQAGNTTYFSQLTDGITVAFTEGATLFQTVIPAVVPGVTYTLMVDLGQRRDLPLLPFRPTAELVVGAVNGVGGVGFIATGTAPAASRWSTFVASFTGTAAESGKSITIELLSSGMQGEFDNVRLSDNLSSAAPEPAGVTLLGMGLAGLLVFAKRKRTS